MGRASSGGTCPLCRNPVSFTATGKLYRHRGNDRALASARRLECRASGATFEVARRLRANKDAGRHPHRNEDGTWLYICDRCGREQIPWDIARSGTCSSARWAHCIRPLTQAQQTEEARSR